MIVENEDGTVITFRGGVVYIDGVPEEEFHVKQLRGAMKTIRVVVKNPGQPAVIRMIKNNTASLQKIVGGYIEPIRPWPDSHAYVNEEGKLKGLEPNFRYGSDVIVGPAVFSKADSEGDEIGFTQREADEILRRVNQL